MTTTMSLSDPADSFGLRAGELTDIIALRFPRPRIRRALILSLMACAGPSTVIPHAKLIALRVESPRTTVTVGDSLALTATGFFDRGNSGAVQPSWRSSAPGTAQVSNGGVVRAVNAGSTWIVASVDQIADSVRLQIAPKEPPLTVGFNNMPPGMTVLSDADLTSLDGPWRYVANSATGSISDDPASPTGLPVFQFNYPQGFVGGVAPASLRSPGLPDPAGAHNYQEFYLGFYWKSDAAWQNHPSNVNKIAFFWTDNSNPTYLVWHWWDGTTHGVPPQSLLVNGLGPNTVNDFITPNQPGLFPLQPGHWYKIEFYLRLATTATSHDGVVRIWVNDRLMMSYADRRLSGYLSDLYFDPVWGGVGSTKQHDDWYRIAHARVAAR